MVDWKALAAMENMSLGDLRKIQPVDVETVDLIAKGYEWNCPYCADLNQTYEAREIYFCGKCGMKVKAQPPDHAYE